MFNRYREVISGWEAFLSWKQLENAPHMRVSSSLSAMTRSHKR